MNKFLTNVFAFGAGVTMLASCNRTDEISMKQYEDIQWRKVDPALAVYCKDKHLNDKTSQQLADDRLLATLEKDFLQNHSMVCETRDSKHHCLHRLWLQAKLDSIAFPNVTMDLCCFEPQQQGLNYEAPF